MSGCKKGRGLTMPSEACREPGHLLATKHTVRDEQTARVEGGPAAMQGLPIGGSRAGVCYQMKTRCDAACSSLTKPAARGAGAPKVSQTPPSKSPSANHLRDGPASGSNSKRRRGSGRSSKKRSAPERHSPAAGPACAGRPQRALFSGSTQQRLGTGQCGSANSRRSKQLQELDTAPIPPGGFTIVKLAPLEHHNAVKFEPPEQHTITMTVSPEHRAVMIESPEQRAVVKTEPPELRVVMQTEPAEHRAVVIESPERNAVVKTRPPEHLVMNTKPAEQLVVAKTEPSEHRSVVKTEPSEHRSVVKTEPPEHRVVMQTEPAEQSAVVKTEPPEHRAVVKTEPREHAALAYSEQQSSAAPAGPECISGQRSDSSRLPTSGRHKASLEALKLRPAFASAVVPGCGDGATWRDQSHSQPTATVSGEVWFRQVLTDIGNQPSTPLAVADRRHHQGGGVVLPLVSYPDSESACSDEDISSSSAAVSLLTPPCGAGPTRQVPRPRTLFPPDPADSEVAGVFFQSQEDLRQIGLDAGECTAGEALSGPKLSSAVSMSAPRGCSARLSAPCSGYSPPTVSGLSSSSHIQDRSAPGLSSSSHILDRSAPGLSSSSHILDRSAPGLSSSSHILDRSAPGLSSSSHILDRSAPGLSSPSFIPDHSDSPHVPGRSNPSHVPGDSSPPHVPGHSHPQRAPSRLHQPHVPGHSNLLDVAGHSNLLDVAGHSNPLDVPGHYPPHIADYSSSPHVPAHPTPLHVRGPSDSCHTAGQSRQPAVGQVAGSWLQQRAAVGVGPLGRRVAGDWTPPRWELTLVELERQRHSQSAPSFPGVVRRRRDFMLEQEEFPSLPTHSASVRGPPPLDGAAWRWSPLLQPRALRRSEPMVGPAGAPGSAPARWHAGDGAASPDTAAPQPRYVTPRRRGSAGHTPPAAAPDKCSPTVLALYRQRMRGRMSWLPYDAAELMRRPLPVGFIDSHCHLDYLLRRDTGRRANSLAEYRRTLHSTFPVSFAGCVAVFCDPNFWHMMHQWSRMLDDDQVWGAFGCHPHNVRDWNTATEKLLTKILTSHKRVAALGEIGLDYSANNNTDHALQKMVFRRQLAIGVTLGLPLVLHVRDAEQDALDIALELIPRDHLVHRHCITSDWPMVQRWMAAFPSCYVGLTPIVCNPHALEARFVACQVPLDRLLLETDAPYFLPNCYRHASQEDLTDSDRLRFSHPGLALHVAAQVAHMRGLQLEEVVRVTAANTRTMYRLPQPDAASSLPLPRLTVTQ